MMKLKAARTGRWHDAPHAHERPRRNGLLSYGFYAKWKRNVPRFAREENSVHQADCVGYPQELMTVFECAAREAPSVSMDPDILNGQPCIRGTRIPVRSVLRAIEHYGSLDAAVKCYPHLTVLQVKDALYFAQVVLEPADGVESTSPAG